MADKISMLIVKVDLDCRKCYTKMRKILCQLQDQERITTISFDDKSKTVAIAGPFDPHRLACKIRCKGGKVVKDVHIMDVTGGNGKPPPPPPNEMGPPSPDLVSNNGKKKKHKDKQPPPAAEPLPPPQQNQPPPPEPEPAPAGPPPQEMHMPPPEPATPERGMASTMPPFHEEDRPSAQPAQLEPPPPPPHHEPPPPPPSHHHHPTTVEYCTPPMKPRPPTPPMPMPCPKEQYGPPVECVILPVEIPSWPAAPVGSCGCPCCAPCYQGYYDGCRCGCGGSRMYGGPMPPPPAWCGYRGCRIINEEDPNAACSIM